MSARLPRFGTVSSVSGDALGITWDDGSETTTYRPQRDVAAGVRVVVAPDGRLLRADSPEGDALVTVPFDPRTERGDYRYSHDGEVFRVVIAGDVIALPFEEWSYGGFAQSISEEWLLGSGNVKLPGKTKGRKRLLAYFIRRALADHHGYAPPAWTLGGDAPRVGR